MLQKNMRHTATRRNKTLSFTWKSYALSGMSESHKRIDFSKDKIDIRPVFIT